MFSINNAYLNVAILDPIADQSRFGSRYCTGGYIFKLPINAVESYFLALRIPMISTGSMGKDSLIRSVRICRILMILIIRWSLVLASAW